MDQIAGSDKVLRIGQHELTGKGAEILAKLGTNPHGLVLSYRSGSTLTFSAIAE